MHLKTSALLPALSTALPKSLRAVLNNLLEAAGQDNPALVQRGPGGIGRTSETEWLSLPPHQGTQLGATSMPPPPPPDPPVSWLQAGSTSSQWGAAPGPCSFQLHLSLVLFLSPSPGYSMGAASSLQVSVSSLCIFQLCLFWKGQGPGSGEKQ